MDNILLGVVGVAFTFLCSLCMIWFCSGELHNIIKNKPLRIFAWILLAIFIAGANISIGYFAWEVATDTVPVDYD